jgi:AsmA protein
MALQRRSTEQDELMPGGKARQQNLGPPPPRRRRRRRAPAIHPGRILWYLAGLGALGLASYAGLALLVNGERLRPNLEAAFSSATGRRVEIRKLSFSLQRLALTAEDLTVAEDPAFGGHVPFLQARRVDLHVRLAPLLFAHQVRVTGVAIDSPIVMLRQNAAGAWNFHSLLKASSQSVTDLDPPSIQVTGGRVSMAGFGDDAHSIRLRDLRLSSPALSLQMSNPLTLTAGVEGGGSVKLEGRAGPTEWEQGAPVVPFNGLVHATNLNLSESNVLSSAPSVSGQLTLDASIESDGRMMRLDGQAKAVKLKLAAAGRPASEPLQAVFTVAHDLTTHAGVVSRCDLRVNKGSAGFTGKYLSAGESPLLNLELAISDAPVTDLSPLLPALGFPLGDSAGMMGGAAIAKIKLDGPLDGPFVTGSLAVNGARVTGFNLSRRLAPIEGLDASDLETEFEIVSWKADLKSGGAGLNLDNLETAIAGLGLLSGSGTIAPDSRLDFNMSGIRGLTGPKGRAIPFTIRGNCADPVFTPGR